MKKFKDRESAELAAIIHNAIVVKVIEPETFYWAIRKDPETSEVYL